MTEIVVLVPSRGRPDRAAAMQRSVLETAAAAVELRFIVDSDDSSLPAYRAAGLPLFVLPDRIGYTASLNAVARDLWFEDRILGAFGDDVQFRTPGWDGIVRRTLATPGIAYGDDLIHGANHPSAVFMSTAIARALGWLALPATSHQWADDGWKRLGQETGVLRFMPEVIVEHLHPGVGKADWDDTYRSVFEDERARRDFEGFTGWVESGGLADDAEKVRSVA